MSKSFPENDHVTKKEFSPVAKEVKEIKRILNPMRISILNMESKMNMYSDMFEINKWNDTKLANRVNKLEKHSGITPPEEFLISGL